MEHSVSVKDLSLNFGAVNVLQSMNLDIAPGEFLVLLGPSGCGKSTLLNCIAGLLDVSDGQIFISGKNVTWEEPKDRGIGMVFQSYALYPQMSVRKNLSFGLQVAGFKKEEIDKRIARASEMLQIEPLLDRKPANLSGGQRQRVAIGRALVRDVDVFLFDEPLSNLDAKLRSDLRVEIKRLHQRLKNTMIYVTHDQIEAMTLADRIAIMKSGVIQQLDAPNVIYNKPVNLFVAGFIGSPSMNFINGRFENGTVTLGGHNFDVSRYEFETGQGGTAQDVILGVRPEHVVIGPGVESQPCQFEAEIEIVEPMGAETVAWTKLAGETFTLRTNSETAPQSGQKIRIGFDPIRSSIFDAQSGTRI